MPRLLEESPLTPSRKMANRLACDAVRHLIHVHAGAVTGKKHGAAYALPLLPRQRQRLLLGRAVGGALAPEPGDEAAVQARDEVAPRRQGVVVLVAGVLAVGRLLRLTGVAMQLRLGDQVGAVGAADLQPA